MSLLKCWTLLVQLAVALRDESFDQLSAEASQIENCEGSTCTFVHLTDPQLGLLNNFGDKTWKEEKDMVTGLAKTVAAKCKFGWVLIGGDMQDAWPDRGSTPENDKMAEEQRADVKTALTPFANYNIRYTAGNHDIGDIPNKATLEAWEFPMWGTGKYFESFMMGSTPCWQITSQFYWTPDDKETDEAKAKRGEQLEFIKNRLKKNIPAIKDAGRLIIFTHIPPFMNDVDEADGWANWRKVHRTEILELMVAKLKGVKIIWVCGHFHTNVENKDYDYKGMKMDIIVTSAAGSTMWWQNNEGSFTPAQAKEVASKDIGQAFFKDIMTWDRPPDKKDGKGIYVQPREERSGLRIFKLEAGKYSSQWYTLKALKDLKDGTSC